MIEIRASRGSFAGKLLRQLLAERNLLAGDNPKAIVSYGLRVKTDLPCLNATAGLRNKYEELDTLRDAGILVPFHSTDPEELTFPLLGRKFHHIHGNDIIPFLANDRYFQDRKGSCDFFSQYIPIRTEYRVWGYRRKHLATYEKVCKYPENLKRIGCSATNGFAFTFVKEPPALLTEIGPAAIDALGLDFGAVDILQGTDGNFHVLEVNTAPGVEGPRVCFTKLADKITRWAELGYPKRKGAE